jgi:formylglycine-generating enzyme required for sulfatase activity
LLTIGQVLHNRYRIEQPLGQGGFGAVYRAVDLTLKVPCALKENTETNPKAQRQFLHEASILAALRHPGLPRVTDYFTMPGQGQYLVMDLVAGEDLQTRLERADKGLPTSLTLEWMVQVCAALAYLHRQKPPVIHRDIKPRNILITPAGQAVLVDFGVAKLYDPTVRTTQGARAVSPGYSPPEQYGTARTDARSDIYALGATLYTLLTGEAPVESVLRTVGTALPPPRALNPNIPPALEAVTLKAMAILPGERYATAEEFSQALRGLPATTLAAPARSANTQVAQPAGGRTRVIHPAVQAPPVSAPQLRLGAPDRRTWLALAALLGIALLAGLGVTLTRKSGQFQAAARATQTAVELIAFPGTPCEAGDPREDPFGIPMVCVPGGEFLMGSTNSDAFAETDEFPQHPVQVDDFWIDQTEVSNAQYRLCELAGACQPPLQTGSEARGSYYGDPTVNDYPVLRVTRAQAADYCAWVGKRLPSEAEWEKAARGADGRVFPWGEFYPPPANCGGKGFDTAPVTAYTEGASPYGALNLAGNVWEWVADAYGADFYSRLLYDNPLGPLAPAGATLTGVTRGGGWNADCTSARAAARQPVTWMAESPADSANAWTGFRCAR